MAWSHILGRSSLTLALVGALSTLTTGCDDAPLGPERLWRGEDETPVPSDLDFCGIQERLFNADGVNCVQCHGPGATAPELSAGASAEALINVESTLYPGNVFVVPGNPDESFLLRKLTGELEDGQGGIMPPGGKAPAALVEAVRTWIADGASNDCGDAVDAGQTSDAGVTADAGTTADAGFDAGAPMPLPCQAKAVFDTNCIACHGGQSPSLVWEDVATSAVNVTSGQEAGVSFIVPGDRTASYLYWKMTDTHGNGTGVMPPSGALAAEAEVIGQWIDDGADTTCTP